MRSQLRARRVRVVVLVAATVGLIGCVADPSRIWLGDGGTVSLAERAVSGQAVVRVYGVATLPLRRSATHTWVLTKRADATWFDRWEVWPVEVDSPVEANYGRYVHKNLISPGCLVDEHHIETIGEQLIGEVTGPQAEAMIDAVEAVAPTYPCRDTYLVFPGPNCDTFTRWLLDQIGWPADQMPDVLKHVYVCQ